VSRERIRGLVAAFILSAVLAPILALATRSTVAIGILFGICCFSAIEIIRLSERVLTAGRIAEDSKAVTEEVSRNANRLAAIIDHGETRIDDQDRLATLAQNMSILNDGSRARSVISEILRDQVAHVEAMTRSAIHDSKISVEIANINVPRHKMFSLFHGNPDTDYFWTTFVPGQLAWYKTPVGELFLRTIDNGLVTGEITEARRLLIFDNSGELDSGRMALCMYLHTRSNYATKVIQKRDFLEVVKNSVSYQVAHDFGIYGLYYVWETEMNPEGLIMRGSINFSAEVISRYHGLYRTLWALANDYPAELFSKYSCTDYEGSLLGDFRLLTSGM